MKSKRALEEQHIKYTQVSKLQDSEYTAGNLDFMDRLFNILNLLSKIMNRKYQKVFLTVKNTSEKVQFSK